MTAIDSAGQFDLAIARSDYLNACSSVEAAVRARIRKLRLEPEMHLGQCVEQLRKAKPAPQYSKSEKAAIDRLLDELNTQWPLRCDIVHGTLSVVRIDGRDVACFVNPQSASPHGRRALLIAACEMADAARGLHALAAKIAPQRVKND